MAEQKPRAARARKKTTEADAVAGKAAAKRSTSAEAAGSAIPPTAKKKAPPPRGSESAGVPVEPADVAVRAYLLWEQGEPGDATDHWLRAEQELVAA